MISKNLKLLILGIVVCIVSCNTSTNNILSDTAAAVGERDTITMDSNALQPSADTAIADTITGLIKNSLVNNIVKNDLNILTKNDRNFIYSAIDLNADGKSEIFVCMKGSYFCGNAGCTVYLLDNEGKKLTTFSIVDGPIVISADKTKGWNDLIIPSKGINYIVKYNGKAYPSNPSMQPKFNGTMKTNKQTVLDDNSIVYDF